MTSLIRWEPFREMSRLVDRLVEDTLAAPLGTFHLYEGVPAVDMYQTDDEVVVKAILPGFRPENIHVSVSDDVLTIRAEAEQERSNGDGSGRVQYHLRERVHGTMARALTLPTTVDAEKAKAEYEHGILTLRLPKAEEVRPKTITVKAKK